MRRVLLAGLVAAALLPFGSRATETATGTPSPGLPATTPVTEPAQPGDLDAIAPADPTADATMRNGREIFGNFLAVRADNGCDAAQSSPRWEQHFSHAAERMAYAGTSIRVGVAIRSTPSALPQRS